MIELFGGSKGTLKGAVSTKLLLINIPLFQGNALKRYHVDPLLKREVFTMRNQVFLKMYFQ